MMSLIKQSTDFVLKEKVRGGEGFIKVFGAPVLEGKVITMACRMEIEPKGMLGYHSHPDDEEVTAIVSGTGIYNYGDGECPANPGDLFVTHAGTSHSLRNTSETEPLVYFAIIAKGN